MSRALFVAALLLVAGARPGVAGDLPWLHAEGMRIVDEQGRTNVLRGVNLGGWLVEEMWMMPFETTPPDNSDFKPVKDHVSLWATVEQRFGTDETARVRTALRRAWITEADFDRIQAAGLNCVRLPFLYDLLDEPDGFQWLDQALRWAKARGIYVVLDLHGAPGRQSDDQPTGEVGRNRLFHDPAMVKQTEEVWARVAQRYRDHSEVAGYDLLNEPMGAPNAGTLYLVYDRLYRAIRAVDTRHLIVIEDGYKGIENMPYPAIVGWQNVLFSSHHYTFNAKSEKDHLGVLSWIVSTVLGKFQRDRSVPWYVGEFQCEPHGTPATVGKFIQAFEKQNCSWTIWTYKTAMKDGGGGMWGWYHNDKALQPLNVFTDSEADLLAKIDQVRTERMNENRELTAIFRSRNSE
jgi:hypothetical protein